MSPYRRFLTVLASVVLSLTFGLTASAQEQATIAETQTAGAAYPSGNTLSPA